MAQRFFPTPTPTPTPTTQQWKQCVLNASTSVFLDTKGQIWVHGWNNRQQLGFPASRDNIEFKPHPTLTNIKRIIGATHDGYFLEDNQGQIWVMGSSYYGELGIGKGVAYKNPDERTDERQQLLACTLPVVVPGLHRNDIKDIVCGQTSFIIKKDGSVLACGRNDYGQLGLGHANYCNQFTLVPNLQNVERIFNNWHSTFFKLQDGSILACGENRDGHLALPKTENGHYTPTLALTKEAKIKDILKMRDIHFYQLFLTEDNTLLVAGKYVQKGLVNHQDHSVTPITIVNAVKDVQNGWECIYFLHHDNTVSALGDPSHEGLSGDYSTLRQIPGLTNIKKLRVTDLSHIIALDTDGQVFSTAPFVQASLLDSEKESTLIPTLQHIPLNQKATDIFNGYRYNLMTMEDGSIQGFGDPKEVPECMQIPALTPQQKKGF